MKYKLKPNFILIAMAIIIGGGIIKQFNTQDVNFEKPALVAVYMIGFVLCIIFMFKKTKT